MTNLRSPFGLRMPAVLRHWLEQRAKSNRRSLNQEILFLLFRIMTSESNIDRGKK